MKLLSFCICLLFICFFSTTLAQNYVIGDQNPRYIESQNKYLKIADSINRWHSTTSQQTYKAYDWREEREQQRRERINNRRYYRNNYWYDYNNNYVPYYWNRINYGSPFWGYGFFRRQYCF